MTKNIVRLDDLDPADLVIKWRMTEMCNISCSYCLRTSTMGLTDDAKRPDAEVLFKQENRLCEVAGILSGILDRTDFRNIKIDTVGGEVSMLNLQKVFERIGTDKVRRIQMTTNLMRRTEYYSALADYLHSRGMQFSLTASFHYEFQPFERYFQKISALKEKADILKCEIVSNEKNQKLCGRFIKQCDDIHVDYAVDADMRRGSLEMREKGLIYGRKSRDERPRYRVRFDDGTETTYRSRSELLCDKSVGDIHDMRVMAVKGFWCTNTASYLYIDFDKAVGRSDDNDSCTNRIPIERFRFQPPKKCPNGRCSLCGHISLWK